MTRKKIADITLKILCVVIALILMFGSAQVIIFELSNFVSLASAKTVEDKSTGFNDLTAEGVNEVFLPNYDSSEITKTNLTKPRVNTFGRHEESYYPSYINQLSGNDFTNEKKADILAENIEIINNTKEMYANGTLKDNLQKHVSADGQFYATGNYDKAPRIEKVTTVNGTASARKHSLGVFAPAGEVLTVTIDERMVGKVTVAIGYPYGLGVVGGDDIPGSGKFDRWQGIRMARYFVEFKLNDTVNYIGTPLGGMVFIEGGSGIGNYKVTVSGGVDMPDYQLGVSTKEDWKNILAAPGPYVWLITPYQIMVMPKEAIKHIEDPYNALMWWHKASMISLYGIAREYTSHFMTPVISVYDSYVYAGEGVAATWAFQTNNPTYWCAGVLDYDNLMKNGSWGALHEYNHHNQAQIYPSNHNTDWGVGYVDEMTNNVLNAASYILLTDIAAYRSETNMWAGNWQSVTDPYCNYNRLQASSNSNTTYGGMDAGRLFGFVDLMHSFGVGKFLDFLRAQYGYGEVEGYTGQNLTQSEALRDMNNFALFMCLYFKTDFVDYLTKVWHFTLNANTINEIRSHKFEEYVSINNLYSVGLKGIETGRPYKVNVGATTVFDFDKYTLCSADTFSLESVGKPQHGKLTKNSNGTYSYVPDSDFTEDSFDLTYQVTLNGYNYKRTLVVKLTANYNYIEKVTYNADQSKGGLTVQEAIAEFEKSANIAASGTANNFTSGTNSGYNLTSFKATVVFPFSKKVTFMVYGDDKALLKIGDKTAFTNAYIGNDNGGINATDNKITMSVKEGELLKVQAYCFNTGGNGSLTLKYSVDDGKTYQNIPAEYCYAYNATKKQIEAASKTSTNIYTAFVDFRNLYINKFYSNDVKYTPTSAQCLDNDGNPVKTVNGADIMAMFDGSTDTGFHTAWQGKLTAYPHNYFIQFDENASFNQINFKFQSGYYAIGEWEVWISEDGVEYTKLKEGAHTTQSNFSIPFDKMVSTKYVKLVVKSNSSGQGFTNIKEIEFVQNLDLGTSYNVYSSADQALNYDNKWDNVAGLYINGKAMHTDGGKVKFYLNGTNMMLFATNGKSTIKIDGKTYDIKANDNNRNPSFIIEGLEDGKHLVEIDAKDMSLDMIKTTGTLSSTQGPNWVVIGIGIGAGVALIGAISAVIVVSNKQKNQGAEAKAK